MAGTAFDPDWRLTVAGVVTAMPAAGIALRRLVAYGPGRDPELAWTVTGGAPGSLPDPYLGKAVELEADWGDGWTTLFRGRCVDLGWGFGETGWERSYTARGLSYLAARVPLTNPEDGGDAFRFNAAPDDGARYDPAKAGRSLGAILRAVLEAEPHAAALDALGIGDYVAARGTGATATATVSGGGGLTITVDDGGEGYSSASPPRVVLVGGDGTYTSAMATVSGDAVASIADSGAAGWTEAPEVWISPLPVETLQDLAALSLVPPFPVDVHGERLWDAIEGLLADHARNFHAWIDPATGVLRVRDQRQFAGPTVLTLDGSDRVHVGGVRLSRSVEDCWQRVRYRGGPNVRAALVGVLPPDGTAAADNGLEWDCGHSGLTDAQAKAVWGVTSFTQPGDVPGRASATPTRTSDKITALTVQLAGFGYAASATGIPVTISGGGGSGASYTANSDSLGRISGFTKASEGSGYTSLPTVAVDPPPGAAFDSGLVTSIVPGSSSSVVTIDPTDARRRWGANFWDQTASGRGGVLWLLDTTAGITSRLAVRVVSNAALSAGGTCALTVEGNVPVGYDAYELYGTAGPAALVWRKLRLTDASYKGKVLSRFPFPVNYRWSDGNAASQTSVPCASVLYSSTGSKPFRSSPIGISARNDTGHLLLDVPAPAKFATAAALEAGGEDLADWVSDVQALLPIADGTLEAIAPADSGGSPAYSGTGHTVEGLEDTLTVTSPQWIDPANQANMDAYAAELLDAHKDATVEGQVPLLRFHGPLLASFGQKVRLDAAYATPWDGVDLPVMGCELMWTGGPAVKYRTHLAVSNRRWAASESHFARPPGMPFGLALGGLEGLNNGGMDAGASLFNPTAGSGFIDPSQWGASGPGAQAVMRMSEGLRSGAIGPMGAARRMAAAHVGGAMDAAAGLVNTARNLSPFTFGGNGGGGPSPRRRESDVPRAASPGAAETQATRERAARFRGDLAAFEPAQSVRGRAPAAAPARPTVPGAAEVQAQRERAARFQATQQLVGLAPPPPPPRPTTPGAVERQAPRERAARFQRTARMVQPQPGTTPVRDWHDDDTLFGGG